MSLDVSNSITYLPQDVFGKMLDYFKPKEQARVVAVSMVCQRFVKEYCQIKKSLVLHIGDTDSREDVIKTVNFYPNLKTIDFRGSSIYVDDQLLTNILRLSWSCKLRNPNIGQIDSSGRLISLDLSHCRKIKRLDFLSWVPKLQTLILTKCSALKDEGFVPISGLYKLKVLNISYCKSLTSKSFRSLKGLTCMETLIAKGNAWINLRAFNKLSTLKSLKSLDLGNCKRVSSKGSEQLTHLTALTYLNLSHCHLICNYAIGRIRSLPNLKKIGLFGCYKVNRGLIESLKEELTRN